MAEVDFTKLNIYQKLALITGEIGSIKKGGTNREQGYAFIEYAAVAGELRTLFAKYGVIVVPRMQPGSKQSRSQVTSAKGSTGNYTLIDMYFTVINADQPDDKFTVCWTGEALDYSDKSTNKAATSALKYYLMRQFNISEQGDDPDASGETMSHPVNPAKSTDATRKVDLAGRIPSPAQINMIRGLARDLDLDSRALEARLSLINTSDEASKAIVDLQNRLAVKRGIAPDERTE